MRRYQNAYLLSCLLVAFLESGGVQGAAVAEDVADATEEEGLASPDDGLTIEDDDDNKEGLASPDDGLTIEDDDDNKEETTKAPEEEDDWDLGWSEEHRDQRMRACMSAVRRMMWEEGYPKYIWDVVNEALAKAESGQYVEPISNYASVNGQLFALTHDGKDRKTTRESSTNSVSVAWTIGCYIFIEDEEVISEMNGNKGINIEEKADWIRTGKHETKAEGRTWERLQKLMQDPTADPSVKGKSAAVSRPKQMYILLGCLGGLFGLIGLVAMKLVKLDKNRHPKDKKTSKKQKKH